jgi:hypothetical protein
VDVSQEREEEADGGQVQVVGDESQRETALQDAAGPAQDGEAEAQASVTDDAKGSADDAKAGADNDDRGRHHYAQESPPSSLPPLGQALAALDAGPLRGRLHEETGEETQEVICDDTVRRWTADFAALVNGEPPSCSLPDARFCPPAPPPALFLASRARFPPSLLHTPPSLLAACTWTHCES